MRISTSQIFNSGTVGMQNRQYDLYKTQNQLSTGRRVLTPADDPIAASQALVVGQSKEVNQQYLTNQSTAMSRLSLLDSTLGSVSDELQNVYEKAIQAGNATLDSAQRGMIATELQRRMESLIGLANQQDGTGLYIFSGFKATTTPFVQTASGATYNGDSGNEMLQVSASQVMATSENGWDAFMQVRNGTGVTDVFKSLQNMINILDPASGVPYTTTAYADALGGLSSSMDHVSTVRASVGARMSALDSLTSSGEDFKLQYDTRLSELQDLDYAEAITKLSRFQMQLEATQLSFKQTSQLSLFNIL